MPNLNIDANWVDLAIIAVILFFLIEGIRHGFWVTLADFLAFFLALVLAVSGYRWLSVVLGENFALPVSFANAIAFLLTAVIAESVLGYIFGHVIARLPPKLSKNKLTKYLAVIPAVGQALVMLAFLLTLIVGLPINQWIKNQVSDSKSGGILLARTLGMERTLSEVFGGVVEETLTYITVKPGTNETIFFKVYALNLSTDQEAEKQMFDMVNKERRDSGLSELSWHTGAVPVAREYARQMWTEGFFGHISPQGEDVSDRLEKNNISFFIVGENLAKSPTTSIAHTGLMNSEGHRANLLEARFRKMAIGVVDNGIEGKIFVQIFTD